jgi:hypothetical protein
MSAVHSSWSAIRRSSIFVSISVSALIVAADFLFYRHVLGWTAGLFVVALLLALLIRPPAPRSRRATWLIALAATGLALTMIEEPTPLSISVTSVAIVVLAITRRQGWAAGTGQWLERFAKLLMFGWLKVAGDAALGVKWARRHPGRGAAGPAAVFWAAGKWIVPLLLGSVFVALFALANPVVERWTSHALTLLYDRLMSLPNLFEPMRVAFWLAVLTVSWGLLRVRTRRSRMPHKAGPQPLPAGPATRYVIPVSYHALVTRCLIVFNLVFAMETILDLFYLTGGRHLPVGISFKEYAHRGSYPLIATALLAAAFVLFAFRRECMGKQWRLARILVYLWIAQNVLLTLSAGWRLHLLVNASNLTRLRLATSMWLALVAAGLLTIVWRIITRRDNAWLLRFNVTMTAIVLYACCFLNLDGFIADYNAEHCMDVARRGEVLGLTYLRDLGIESIPALDRLSHTLNTPTRRAMARDFAQELRGRVAEEMSDWRGWTWRRARLSRGPH